MTDDSKPARERGIRLAVAPITDVEVRDPKATGDGSWVIEGYAAVFEQETTLFDGRWFKLREQIARGAFGKVLEGVARGDELVHLNFGHDMNTAIASSAKPPNEIGGLELEADFHGLRFFGRVDPDDSDAARLAVKLRRGVVNQASFAFTIAGDELVEELTPEESATDQFEELWRITEIGHLYDVCACAQGAYQQTESHIRAMMGASLGRAGFDPAGLTRRDGEQPSGGASVAQPDEIIVPDAGVEPYDLEHAVRLAKLKAKSRTLAITLTLN